MMSSTSPVTALLRNLFACALLALAACGGGVETGGTGTGAYVQGPISGFGSVIVAGVRFDDAAASIDDSDGLVRRREDLRLGMLVEVESGAISDDGNGGRTATATRVRLGSELLGPVTALAPALARIVVLGQPVRYSLATVIDGVGGIELLAVGDVVEVHGFFDPAGSYVATRIERRSAAPATFRVRGEVRGFDALTSTLRIGAQDFDLSTSGVPAGLADGQFVRLTVLPAQVGGRWKAVTAALDNRAVSDREVAELEGLVTAFAGATQFSVNGVRVDAGNALISGGSPALGVRVKVRGRSQAGVLVAALVEIRSDNDAFNDGFDIREAIESVDPLAQTFVLRGITVFYGMSPRFDGGTAANIVPAQRVRVRGTLSPDRTQVVATRIEFVNN